MCELAGLKNQGAARRSERGAALVTMLLVSLLILAAGGALIVSTASSATNAVDSVTERQAYYAAETGLQYALNALRGNMTPDASVAAADRLMSLRRAVTPDASNGAGRSSSAVPCGTDVNQPGADQARCRLAGWLPYTVPGSNASAVPFGAPNLPSRPSFRLMLFDPDNSHNVTFSTDGTFSTAGVSLPAGVTGLNTSADARSLVIDVTSGNQLTLTYTPRGDTSVNNAVSATGTNHGTFTLSKANGAAINLPASGTLASFKLKINQTAPWQAAATLRATLSAAGSNMVLSFTQDTVRVGGTTYTLPSKVLSMSADAASVPTAPSQLIYNAQVIVTAPEPKRVVVRSIGFGPKFAQKRLEMVVKRSSFDFEAPATVTLRGADDCSSSPSIDTGSSGAKEYIGQDKDNPSDVRPPFAVAACNYDEMVSGIKKMDTINVVNSVSLDPKVGILGDTAVTQIGAATTANVDMPSYLESAQKARDYLNEMQAKAEPGLNYFKPAAGTTKTVTDANFTTQTDNFIFVDGNASLDTTASTTGILVVTGKLEMKGNPSFNGIILVLGEGTLERSGGGSGDIYGSMVVARFDRYGTGGFLAPTFTTDGGGDSKVQFSSVAIAQALKGVSTPGVNGVLEY